MEKARPTLLEPIMDVEVFTPQEVSGDIMGDLNSRRGRVQGMDMRGKQQVIKAQVPLSEMLDYQSKLNSVTQARGTYHMQFSHYDPLPGNLAQKVIDEAVAAGRVRAHDDDGLGFGFQSNKSKIQNRKGGHFARLLCLKDHPIL